MKAPLIACGLALVAALAGSVWYALAVSKQAVHCEVRIGTDTSAPLAVATFHFDLGKSVMGTSAGDVPVTITSST